jgi:hypothetical protein
MSKPSKDQLRKKYGIREDDFQILTELPPEHEIRNKGFLQKVGEALGVEEWMLKSWRGRILAVIILVPTAQGIFDYWEVKVEYPVAVFADYFRHLKWPVDTTTSKWIVFRASTQSHIADWRAPEKFQVDMGIVPAPDPSPHTDPIQFVAQVRYHYRQRFSDVPPGGKQVSAPATVSEMLPLSKIVRLDRGPGRVVEGTVGHLPYSFRITVVDPEIKLELYRDNQLLGGFPQTKQQSLKNEIDSSRTDFLLPVDNELERQITADLLGERCFLTYVNLVIGVDDDLIRSAFLGHGRNQV